MATSKCSDCKQDLTEGNSRQCNTCPAKLCLNCYEKNIGLCIECEDEEYGEGDDWDDDESNNDDPPDFLMTPLKTME